MLEYIGKTKTKNLVDEIQSKYFEVVEKKFPKVGGIYSMKPRVCCLVTALKDNEILEIGLNCKNDLILDNFGAMLAGMVSGKQITWTMKSTSAQVNNFRNSGANITDFLSSVGNVGNSNGARMNIGSGSTPPTRQDFAMETQIAGLGVFPASYNSGLAKVSYAGVFSPTSTNDTVREVSVAVRWRTNISSPTGGTFRELLLTREVISPFVGFLIGQTVNVDYGFVFS